MATHLKVSHLINGEWLAHDEGFESRNPANLEELVAIAPIGTEETVLEAAHSAQHAFSKFKRSPAPYRGELIHNLGALVRSNKEALAQLLTREMGKPIREARGSVQEVIDTCVFFASEGRRLYGQTVPSEMPNKKLFTFRRPVGVCGIITAGNFPIAVPAWYIVPAVLCGNTIIWKPSEIAPGIAHAFASLMEKSGFPKGVLNVVHGGGKTGEALAGLCDKGLIQKIGFTGGTQVGKQIGQKAGLNLQKACLELGGKNPLVVMPDCNLEAAVEAAVFSAFGTSGQRCTSLGILMLHESIKEVFLDHFLEKVTQITIGDPRKEDTFYGPMMAKRFMDDYQSFCDEWIEPHHEIRSPSKGRITSHNPWLKTNDSDLMLGLYAHPVVVDNVKSTDTLFLEETFGPIMGITSFNTFDEALDLANTSGYGLSAAIFTNDPKAAFTFQEEVRSGMISINNSTSGAEAHLPFGGIGRSGNGARQSGIWVIDEFTYWQSVNWDYSNAHQLAQIDVPEIPFDPHYTI